MLKIPGYQILTQIYNSINSEVYRAIRKIDGEKVILKVLKQDYPTPSELTRYKQEYELIRTLNQDGVIKAYGFKKYYNSLVMFVEDFGGESLKIFKANYQFSLDEFLSIAIKISTSLGQIHAAKIIHKDINPANIVLNPKTQQLKIIDFGISTRLTRENPTLKNPNVLEGTLPYISPEQTGRMNRSLDYRTDFYSLGVTLYELLTGQLPFETEDELELVHCHLAKQPLSPSEINPLIPEAVSDIVLKLMAKNAEERYQSTWGVKADLETCLNQFQSQGTIVNFPLATEDISDQFQIPQKLYGRELEIETLITAFERVSNQTNDSSTGCELMLISGYAGIGKSALVQEIYKPITEKRGYFIAGKFEQFQRNIPYSAVVNAFQQLVKQILTENNPKLQAWRTKLLAALGSNSQIIIDVIPEVELIIGKQPAVPELGPPESQNRFNLVFKNFIHACCAQDHPLVIFLDDLQWADGATLKLIELMMTEPNLQYLFLIGSYRDNEVSLTHPLMILVEELRKSQVIIHQINLTNLGQADISRLLADTLKRDQRDVQRLADLVLNKTDGNPFFVNQFLKLLYTDNLITFNYNNQKWDWDLGQIEAINITDNVVDLMIGKLKQLPDNTQSILQLAACVGANFDLQTLSLIGSKTPSAIFPDLLIAVEAGLILPLSELDQNLLIQEYKFLHDRVQQAAYSLIDQDVKKAVHFQIGRLLLENLPKSEQDTRIFEIVDHLNLGQDLIRNETEKLKLVKLNLEAGKKAKDATAYMASLQYLKNGLACLSPDCWHHHYQLSFNFYKELAEVEYLNGNFDQSEALINLMLQQVQSSLEKVEIYSLLMMQYIMSAKYKEAIVIGQKALALLGVDLPDINLQDALQIEIEQAKQNLGTRKISALIDEPEISDIEKRLALKLLIYTDPPAYFSNQELYAVIVVKMANISLKYGNIAESAKGFVTYGIILGSVLGDYQSGYQFGKLSVQISEKFNNNSQKCSSCLVLAGHLNHWVKHIKEAEAIFNQSYQAGLECGEFLHSGYALEHQLRYLFYQGKNLESLVADVAKFLPFSQKTKNQWATDGMLGFQITLFNLTGRTPDSFVFCNDIIGEQDYLKACHLHNSFAWVCTFNIFKSQVLYLYDKLPEALVCAREAKKYIRFTLGHFQFSEHNFYTSLILAALYPTISESEQKQYWEELELQQKQMKIWADNCPENFLHKSLLIEAEMARISGQEMAALELYDLAIASARENEYIQNEALGNELAAKFWFRKNKPELAEVYLKKAYYNYNLWGATTKVKDLEKKYPQLLTLTTTPRLKGTITNCTSGGIGTGEILDLATVMKASQAISGEIVLEKLLVSLMKIIIENAGAQLGYLVLETNRQLLIEASGVINDDHITALQSIPIDNYLPVTVVNYVARLKEDLVLNHATREGNFVNDPYIITHQPKSILCTPLLNQGQLTGIVYLENNLTTGAFTENRLEVIKLLSGQAAIALENARLYQTLENKVIERTAQLAAANQEISTLNEKLKAENLRLSAELDVAKKIQEMVLPKPSELEAVQGLDIAGYMEPADEVGGDYYDVLSSETGVKIAIGDVTGHGLESGVLMLMAQTAVRTLQNVNETDPIRFLDRVNQTLYDNLQRMNSDKNMTLAILDYADGVVKLSGQHEEMIIVRTDGTVEKIDTIDLGFPIGLNAQIAEFINQKTIQLNSQDVVILYSDGITEAENIHKNLYGLEKLCQIVKENRHLCAHEIREAVIQDVQRFIGTQKVFDDITLVVLKQK